MNGYWDNTDNQYQFIVNLAKELHITTPEGWFRVNRSTLCNHGGAQLLNKYGSLSKGRVISLIQLSVLAIMPEYKMSCRQFVLDIMQELKFTKVEEVMNVPLKNPFYSVSLTYQIHQTTWVIVVTTT